MTAGALDVSSHGGLNQLGHFFRREKVDLACIAVGGASDGGPGVQKRQIWGPTMRGLIDLEREMKNHIVSDIFLLARITWSVYWYDEVWPPTRVLDDSFWEGSMVWGGLSYSFLLFISKNLLGTVNIISSPYQDGRTHIPTRLDVYYVLTSLVHRVYNVSNRTHTIGMTLLEEASTHLPQATVIFLSPKHDLL